LTNRKSWFEEVGYAVDKLPGTWDEYRAAGKKLKAAGHPFGQTAGHTFGDAPSFWYPFLWSFGGREIADDKKTVALDSKETVESVKFAVAFWKDCCDEGGLAWDDSSNNRAFLSGTISSSNNGAETSPVYAPSFSQWTFCAYVVRPASTQSRRRVNGGQTTASSPASSTGSGPRNIFQLPAMSTGGS